MVMDIGNHGSSGDVELTDDVLERLADEAAQGYPRSQLQHRHGRGRPPMGRAPAQVFHVRLEPDLRQALDERAERDGTTTSDVARKALSRVCDTFGNVTTRTLLIVARTYDWTWDTSAVPMVGRCCGNLAKAGPF
ncbi:hypothetical protein BH24ACT15_BH24ACT15_13170 [soil metagenome]